MIIVTGIGKNIQEMLKVKIYKFIKSIYTVSSFKFIVVCADLIIVCAIRFW
jgi:hypothetical protein